jgi:hypothetical protein
MHETNGKRRKHNNSRLFFAAAAVIVSARAAQAATENWIGGISDWNSSGNWDIGVVPGAGDTVNVINTLGVVQSVSYDYTGTAVTLNTLTIDLLGAPLSANTLAISANSLSAGAEYFGYAGNGAVVQSGGTNTVTAGQSLYVANNAGSTGSYALSGTAALSVSGGLFVGYGGAGTFSETGGSVTTAYGVYIGSGIGSTGAYTLVAGSISSTGIELVGGFGIGNFNQTGGTNTITSGQSLYVANNAGSTGSYALSGTASLSTTGGIYVGYGGAGSFTQTGGSVTTAYGINLGSGIGSTGAYTLGAGSISSTGIEVVGNSGTGNFNQTGGTNTITNGQSLYVGSNNGATGSYELDGTASLTVSGGENIGYSGGTGTFIQDGGTNSEGNSLIVAVSANSVGLYTLIAGSLDVTGKEEIGYGARGIFNQSGGTNNVLAVESFYLGVNSGAPGGYFLSGTGTLSVSGNEYIGQSGTGNFNQSAGMNVMEAGRSLYVGYNGSSTASYTLSGGSLSVTGSEYIGYSGSGSFNQSNGTNQDNSNSTVLGENAGSMGTYLLSGGTLIVVGDQDVGYQGAGLFNQSGGSTVSGKIYSAYGGGALGNILLSGGVMQTPNLILAYQAGSTGAFTLSGSGSLSVSSTASIGYSGVGSFIQTGGTMTAATVQVGINSASVGTYSISGGLFQPGNLYVGNGAGSSGSFTLSSVGTLTTTTSEYVGYTGAATFTQTGGNNLINGATALYVGSAPGSVGTYILNGTGTLTAKGNESIGVKGQAIFNQSGGLNLISGGHSLTIDNSGIYFLSGGGSLSSTGGETVGSAGIGFFNQSGGVNTSTSLFAGFSAGSTGAYVLSGTGSLASSGSENIGYSGLGFLNQSAGMNSIQTDLRVAFNANSTGTYTLSGTGSLAVSGSEYVGNSGYGTFNQTGGLNAIAASGSLDLGAFSGGASGIYMLSGGALSVGGGVYVGGNSSAANGSGVLTVSNSGQVSVSGLLKVWNKGRVNLDVPSTTVGNLSIVGNGIVNLNGAMNINYGSPASDPIGSVVSYLQSGYNAGAWTGTSGIISTSITTSPQTSIGYADGNIDTGTIAGPNQIVVKYTLAGDANLDGLVNFNDLVAVVQNFNKSGTDWAQGNFLYGGSTNFNDLVAVVQNFNKVLTPAGDAEVAGEGPTIALSDSTAIQSRDVQLPEPGSLSLFAAGAVAVLSIRRRSRLTK